MLAFAHELPHPVHNGVLQKPLDLFLGDGNVMSIFLILGMECKHQRQIVISGLRRRGLPEEKWVMGVNDIQLQLWDELVYERRDG